MRRVERVRRERRAAGVAGAYMHDALFKVHDDRVLGDALKAV